MVGWSTIVACQGFNRAYSGILTIQFLRIPYVTHSSLHG